MTSLRRQQSPGHLRLMVLAGWIPLFVRSHPLSDEAAVDAHGFNSLDPRLLRELQIDRDTPKLSLRHGREFAAITIHRHAAQKANSLDE